MGRAVTTSGTTWQAIAFTAPAMAGAGWDHRRTDALYEKYRKQEQVRQKEAARHLPVPQSDFDPIVADAPPEVEPTQGSPSAPDPASDNTPYTAALARLASAPTYDEIEQVDPSNEPKEPGMPHLSEASPLDAYDEFIPHFDKATQQETGVIIGIGVVSGNRYKVVDPATKKTSYCEPLFVVPGDDVTISCLSLGSDHNLLRSFRPFW